jgi:hypothetical protein
VELLGAYRMSETVTVGFGRPAATSLPLISA